MRKHLLTKCLQIFVFWFVVTSVTPAHAASVPTQKLQPAGIIRLFNENFSRPENLPAWANPNLDGMRLRPYWGEVQPGNTTFVWSAIDQVLDLGAQHGKFIGLSVAAGTSTPQWVYNSGATKYALQDGSGLSMPLPWEPAFLNKWLAFVGAMGARYDGNPSLGYIVMSGMGQHVETYLGQTQADIDALTALGGPSAWVTAAKKIITAYADAFPTTPFFMTTAKPFGLSGLPALQEVVDWGAATYPGRFGIMNASLAANSDIGYYPHLAVYTYRATQPVGFQQLCSETNDSARLQGTLGQALKAGVQLGGKFVEVYQADADDRAQQTVLATQGAALKANVFPRPPTGLHVP